jgi:hypothetical protein
MVRDFQVVNYWLFKTYLTDHFISASAEMWIETPMDLIIGKAVSDFISASAEMWIETHSEILHSLRLTGFHLCFGRDVD